MDYSQSAFGMEMLFPSNLDLVEGYKNSSTNSSSIHEIDQPHISINNVTSRMEQIVDEMLWDTKMQFFIELFQVIVFTYLFLRTIERNSIRLQRQMKVMLITFEFLLIMSCLNTFMFGHILEGQLTKRKRLTAHMVYNYINRSVFLILLFKILFAFKKVELQINPDYDQVMEIVRILRRQVLVERLFLGVYAVLVIFYLYMVVIWHQQTLMQHKMAWAFFVLDSGLVAALSLYLMNYFYKMASFFIKLLDQTFEINAFWSRAYIAFLIVVISLYIFRDYILIQFTLTFTRVFQIVTFDRQSVGYINFQRVLNFIKQFAPFTIAIFITNLVDYFAREASANIESDYDSYLQNGTNQQQQAKYLNNVNNYELGHSLFDSHDNTIIGSINDTKYDPNQKQERQEANLIGAGSVHGEVAPVDDLTAGAIDIESLNRTVNQLSRGGVSKRRIKNITLALRRRKDKNLDPLRNPSEFQQEQAIQVKNMITSEIVSDKF